ncbi:unnamed protein product, partial [Meganyctiphanes norvegica]
SRIFQLILFVTMVVLLMSYSNDSILHSTTRKLTATVSAYYFDQPVSTNKRRVQDIRTHGPKTVLWPNDTECNRFEVGFSSGHPTVLFSSFPRSGNTWVRYLVEGATGVYTNVDFGWQDPNMFEMGYQGEREERGSGRCVLTKTHSISEHEIDDKLPTILLIRNPARAIVSWWNLKYVRSGNETNDKFVKNAPIESYNTT